MHYCSSTTVFQNHSKCLIEFFKFGIFHQLDQLENNLSGNTVWPQATILQKVAKLTIIGIFDELLSPQNVNVARFARYIEWDVFCDFQTLWALWIHRLTTDSSDGEDDRADKPLLCMPKASDMGNPASRPFSPPPLLNGSVSTFTLNKRGGTPAKYQSVVNFIHLVLEYLITIPNSNCIHMLR